MFVFLFPRLISAITLSALTEKYLIASYKASNYMFFQKLKNRIIRVILTKFGSVFFVLYGKSYRRSPWLGAKK